MTRLLILLLSVGSYVLTACPKRTVDSHQDFQLEGVWIREGDLPGQQPADTLFFTKKDGKPHLSFYSAGSPGPGWPSHAQTEYRFENGKLSFKDYSGSSTDYMDVESFQWIDPGKTFSVKLYQLLLFMSADYRVTYKKVQ